MTRVPKINLDDLSPDQRAVHDLIVSTRQGGEIRGPFALWVRNANLAAAANQMGNSLRLEGNLDGAVFELIILIVARHWSAQYEWFAHAKEAANVGLDPEIIEAIRTHRVPSFKDARQKVIYEMVRELLETKDVATPTYTRALDLFGLDLVIEIVTVAGFYALIAMVLKSFDAPVPGGARPLDL